MKYRHISMEQSFYIGIVMWGFLYLFPSIDRKSRLPRPLWNLIKDLYFQCPCCAVYYDKRTKLCHGCPLEHNCIHSETEVYFKTWTETESEHTRKAYARKILDRILDSRDR